MIGNVVKEFKIIKMLGSGGMATVYLANNQKLDTQIAIKILNKELTLNENIRKRFIAEAKYLYQLSHPKIIKVLDLIEHEGTTAIIMEYIEGETLKNRLERQGPLKDEEIKDILFQMLHAVGHVHEHNLVHRDIKPSNFMITANNHIKLMDFGIAKNIESSGTEYTQTGTGLQLGTPMYMSPEQIIESKEVNSLSDIYSLGVVLWQMVTGRKPYDIKTLSTFNLQVKIVNEKLDNTNTIWDGIIQKATSKDPKNRFQNHQEILDAVNAINHINNSSGDHTFETKNLEQECEKTSIDSTVVHNSTEKIKNSEILLEASVLVQEKLKVGFINLNGDWVIQPMFDDISKFDDVGFCGARINGQWGFIDRQGRWIIQPTLDYISEFDDVGFCEAMINDKYGFIDQQGRWIIQPMFDSISKFDDVGFCKAEINEKYGFIDRQGRWIIQPMFVYIDTSQFDDVGFCGARINEKYGFIDRQGRWIIQPMFDSISEFDDVGFCGAKINGQWGFIDRQGRWIIQPMFEDVGYNGFYNNYCTATLNGKEGIIDGKGNWIVEPLFEEISFYGHEVGAYSFEQIIDGAAMYGLMNNKFDILCPPIFGELYQIRNAKNRNLFFARHEGKWAIINNQGQWITFGYFLLEETNYSGIIKASKNNKYGYINEQGEWLIQPNYDYVLKCFDGNDLTWDETDQNWHDLEMEKLFLENNKEKIHAKNNELIPEWKLFRFIIGGLGLLFVFFIIFSSSSNEEPDQLLNHVIYLNDTIPLVQAYANNEYLTDIYLFDSNLPITSDNSEIAKLILRFCHTESNEQYLIVDGVSYEIVPNIIPEGTYTFKKEVGQFNWKPFALLEVSSNDGPLEIAEGSEVIVKRHQNNLYYLEWNINLGDGNNITGNYLGEINNW
jgi:serine/threonine protein kinase